LINQSSNWWAIISLKVLDFASAFAVVPLLTTASGQLSQPWS